MNDETVSKFEQEVNMLVDEVGRAKTISEAENRIEKVQETLGQLMEAYKERNDQARSTLAQARIYSWESYRQYIKGKTDLIEMGVANKRGQFSVGFQRKKLVIGGAQRIKIQPVDMVSRIKLSGILIDMLRNTKLSHEKMMKAIKMAYKLCSQIQDQDFSKSCEQFIQNWARIAIEWKLELLSIGTITAILKAEREEVNALIDKHLDLASQLKALNAGQKEQSINLLDERVYREIFGFLNAKYFGLTDQRGGIIRKGWGREMNGFLELAEPILDITIPEFVLNLQLKELFPRILLQNKDKTEYTIDIK
ncbi:MAG: hypothetical protein ACFE7E_06430 [Candidatus Hodarchaeota archaeon]